MGNAWIKPFRLSTLTLLVATLFAPMSALAGTASDTSRGLVTALYRNYAWQAIAGPHAFDGYALRLRYQNLPELEKYFTPALAKLIRKGADCEARTGRVCTPSFDYLFGSHGDFVEDLNIVSTGSPKLVDLVQVNFKDPLTEQTDSIDCELEQTDDGWRISDIGYLKQKTTLSAALQVAMVRFQAAPPAVAAPTALAQDTARATVQRLYRDYAWEAFFDGSDAAQIEGQTLPELKKYFDDELAGLLWANTECVQKTGDMCRLDEIIIFASQDPLVSDLTISNPNGRNQVRVTYQYPGNEQQPRLRYDMVKTASGWRIHDIYDPNVKYSLRASLKR